MKKSLLTVSLLLAANLNFAMSPLVKNLSRVSNQLNRKITPNHIAQSLPYMLDQKRNSIGGDIVILGIIATVNLAFIAANLQDIKKESKKTNDLLEIQNHLLKEQVKIKNSDGTIK
jgi:hypothetical protein